MFILCTIYNLIFFNNFRFVNLKNLFLYVYIYLCIGINSRRSTFRYKFSNFFRYLKKNLLAIFMRVGINTDFDVIFILFFMLIFIYIFYVPVGSHIVNINNKDLSIFFCVRVSINLDLSMFRCNFYFIFRDYFYIYFLCMNRVTYNMFFII